MRIHTLAARPPADLARALERFERSFSYPLGTDRRFRISHGEDYTRFFRAIGKAAVFVAERDGKVLGTLGAAVRRLARPDGETSEALYIGDLKVLTGATAGFVLTRLAAALQAWAAPQVTEAFAIVMDGTRATPERYTGRFGIPAFRELAKIMVLRLACDGHGARRAASCFASESQVGEAHRRLVHGSYAAPGGFPQERSAMAPVWLGLDKGRACAMMEDTFKAKRLFALDGPELVSAHLSYFAFESALAGAELLDAAAALAHARGFPALFCCAPAQRVPELVRVLGTAALELAPATVYGLGLREQLGWHLNTSEI
jgi:hypothetical protein